MPSAKFKGKSGLGDYADFVMQFDDEVGQINQALKDSGLDKNTLLIFTSDNGTGPGNGRELKEFFYRKDHYKIRLKSNIPSLEIQLFQWLESFSFLCVP